MIPSTASLVVGGAWLDLCIWTDYWNGPEIRDHTFAGRIPDTYSWFDTKWLGESRLGGEH